ncbi:hypothetical protein [Streptomyces nigrescens]
MNEIIRSGAALLPYSVETFPPELTAGTPGAPVTATLKVVVGAGLLRPVRCDRLTVKLRIGEGASAWTGNRTALDSGVVGGEPPGQGDGWTKYAGYPEGDWQVFEFEPTTTAVFDGSWRLTLNLFNIEVNSAPGWAEFQIVEKTATSGATSDKFTSAQVQKAPSAFVFHSFHPKDLLVGNGDCATLLWQGTRDAAYTMYWGGSHEELKFGPDQPFGEWRSPELNTPTGFMLQARYTEDGKTYERTLTTTVSVIKPDLELRNLTVNGTLTAKGAVTANSTLTAHGAVTAKSTLKAEGTLTADSTLNANGDVIAVAASRVVRIRELRGPNGVTLRVNSNTEFLPQNAVTVNGTIDAKGGMTATGSNFVRIRELRGPYGEPLKINSHTQFLPGNDVTISRMLETQGLLKVSGPTELLGQPQSWSLTWNTSRTFTAPTSGLAIGHVFCGGGNRNPMVTLSSENRTTRASALKFNSPARSGYETAVLGIRKGRSCTVAFKDSGGDSGPDWKSAWFIWIPFGSGSISL